MKTASVVQRLASWPMVLGSGLVWLVFAIALFQTSAPFALPHVEEACGSVPLDVRFYSTGEDVSRFLTDCGETGRAAYRNLQIADLFYPAVFGLFMASALALALTRLLPRGHPASGFALVAFVGSGFDYLENLFAWSALSSHPDIGRAGSLLGVASAAKTSTFWIVGVVLMVCLALLAIRAIRTRVAGRRLGTIEAELHLP